MSNSSDGFTSISFKFVLIYFTFVSYAAWQTESYSFSLKALSTNCLQSQRETCILYFTLNSTKIIDSHSLFISLG